MNLAEHIKNRSAFPPEQLAEYYGKYVAWSLDGTRILASGEDDLDVFRKVTATGQDLEQVVFSYVAFPDEVMMSCGRG